MLNISILRSMNDEDLINIYKREKEIIFKLDHEIICNYSREINNQGLILMDQDIVNPLKD